MSWRLDEAAALPPRDSWPERADTGTRDVPATLNLCAELVDRHLPGRAGKIAISAPDGTLTYEALAARADAVARTLIDRGVAPGDRVLLRMANGASLAASWLAVQRIGAIAVTSFPMLKAPELDAMLDDAQPVAVVVDRDLRAELDRTRAGADGVILIDIVSAAAPRATTPVAPAARPRDAVATITYTADPDSPAPRGACHSAADWLAIGDAYARGVLGATDRDVFGGTPPLSFAYGLGALLIFPLSLGATASLTTGFDAASLAASIARDRISLLFGTPTSFKLLMRVPDFEHRTTFDALRLAIASGERLDAEVAREWFDRTGVPLVDGFGTTEMAHIFVSQDPSRLVPGTLGHAVPGYDVCVVDDEGREVQGGATGRLVVRGRTGCRYWRRPDAQRRTVRDGWTWTGDLVERRADGELRYVGRADDLIVSAGYNISGVEVARALREHPAVANARVIGVPDPVRGAVPIAEVALHPGVSEDGLTMTLQQFLQARLAPYKVPRRYTTQASRIGDR